MGSILEEFLKKNLSLFGKKEKLLLADKALAQSVHKSLGIECEGQTSLALESTRFVRNHFASLLPNVDEADLTQMNLGLAHSLSRYKLKFSPDKVDTMIVQAVALLDDLDKELNTYAMRAREVIFVFLYGCVAKLFFSSLSGTDGTFRKWRAFSTTMRHFAK